MPDRPTIPPFPSPVEAIAPAEIVAAWGATELGAYLHLVRCAWTRDPACSLPDDDTTLAMMARVRPEEWTATRARLLPVMRSADGLVHFDHARRAFDALADQLSRRRSASRQANEARWGAKEGSRPRPPDPGGRSEPDADRIRFASDSDANRTKLRLALPESVQPRSVPNHSDELKRSRDASEARFSDSNAGTLNASEGIFRRVRAKLAEATFPLASDPKRRAFPARVIDDAARWAAVRFRDDQVEPAPMRVEFALERIRELVRTHPHSNPAALLFAALGTPTVRNAAPKPWDVPIAFAQAWRSRERAALDTLTKIAAARARAAAAVNPTQKESAS